VQFARPTARLIAWRTHQQRVKGSKARRGVCMPM
jgi:hypothetical protein